MNGSGSGSVYDFDRYLREAANENQPLLNSLARRRRTVLKSYVQLTIGVLLGMAALTLIILVVCFTVGAGWF
jgi:hypothetical protein